MLEGKNALVTGSSSGIGLEIARQLARAGANVILVSRHQTDLSELGQLISDKYGVSVLAFPQDLSLPNAAKELMDKIYLEGWKVDILVNNAGFGAVGDFPDLDLQMQKDMMSVNMTALTELTYLCLPYMMEQGWGRILNLASMAAFQPGPFMAIYFATKAFVYSFSSALHEELLGTGVSVTALCPGYTNTNFAERAGWKGKFGGADPAKVATAGLKGLFKKQRVVVPGVENNIVIFLERFAPTGLVVKTIAFMQRHRVI